MRRLIGAALLAAAAELSGLGLLGTAAWLLVRAADRPPLQVLSVAIVAVRALAIAKGGLRYLERLVGHDSALRILADLRTRVYAGLVARAAPLPTGDLLSRLVSDVDGVQDALLRCALPAAVGLLVALATVGFTLAYAPLAALVVAAGLVLTGVVLPAAGYGLARRAARQQATVRGEYLAAGLDVLHGAADLAAFGATGAALDRAADRASALARRQRSAGRAAAGVDALGVPLPALTAALVALVAGGTGPPPAVLALVALAALESVRPLSTVAVRWAELRGTLARVRPLWTEVGPAPDRPEPEPGRPLGPAGGELRVANVTVSYRPDRPPALAEVDLVIRAGDRIALTGPSGAGKSTLLGLLAGTVTPSDGTVTVAGTPVAAVDRWRHAGGVLADAYVFHASVRENLTLGRTGFTDEDLVRALATAGLSTVEVPLDRVVGEDGGQLSGGQRQRVLLARALLDPPPVLLLDEPTEGLDPEAARTVLAATLAAVPGHAVVLVTHHEAELAGFDQVLSVAGGRIGAIPESVPPEDVRRWYPCPSPTSTAT